MNNAPAVNTYLRKFFTPSPPLLKVRLDSTRRTRNLLWPAHTSTSLFPWKVSVFFTTVTWEMLCTNTHRVGKGAAHNAGGTAPMQRLQDGNTR